mgnify:CR=1 FL=1
MSRLRVPIISIVIGEGGSGGALAIGVGDRLVMLEYSIYSVISPEGCASILWKSADKAEEAAEAMGVTADRLKSLGLVDEVLREPLGGAHRDPDAMAANIKQALLEQLDKKQLPESWRQLLRYLNRLSDFLFVLARYCNRLTGVEEPLWIS